MVTIKTFINPRFHPYKMKLRKDIPNLLEDKRSRVKKAIDKYLDPTLFTLGFNALYLWGADKTLDLVSQKTDEHEGIAMLGTYLALTAGIVAANKFVMKPVAKFIKNRAAKSNRRSLYLVDDRKSWLRTGVQLMAFPIAGYIGNFPQTVDNFRYDGERIVGAFARESREDIETLEAKLDETPRELIEQLPPGIDEKEILESNKHSLRGQFLRTYRWNNIIAETEKQYGIEDGLLGAVAMHESYGDPLELNAGDDGGAGLMMFQPGTAQAYGLKTWGDSRRAGRDRNHGTKLRKLARQHNWDYEELSGLDERFDVGQSVDAAARYLKELHDKHGSWDKALSGYNQGTPARNASSTTYVKNVRASHRYWLTERSKRN